jgi:hypothetical protein
MSPDQNVTECRARIPSNSCCSISLLLIIAAWQSSLILALKLKMFDCRSKSKWKHAILEFWRE